MANNTTGFLKTVSIGGFDKKDVLAYVDDLNSKIYKLEAELQDAKNIPAPQANEANNEDLQKLQKQVTDERARANELQGKVDTLTLNVQSYENEITEKENEIKTLKDKIADLEDEMASGATNSETNSSVDIGNIFIEAQKTAQKIIAEQRAQARKMEEEANQLAEQVVDEANDKAQQIISEATEKASKEAENIETQAKAMISNAEFIKNSVKSEIDLIYANISDLNDKISEFAKESSESIEKSKTIIDGTDLTGINGEVYGKFEEIKEASKEVDNIVNSNPRQESVESDENEIIMKAEIETEYVYENPVAEEPVYEEQPAIIADDNLREATQAVYQELQETEANAPVPHVSSIMGEDDLAALLSDVEKTAEPMTPDLDNMDGTIITDEVEPMNFDEMAKYAESLQSQIEAEANNIKPVISEL